MSKLITFLQLLLTTPGTASVRPWSRQMIRRLSVALGLLITGSILTGVLITAALLWGYRKAIEYGYNPNTVALVLALSVVVILAAVVAGFVSCVRGIKSEFRPIMTQPISVMNHVSNGLHDAVRGFTEGFRQGAPKESNTSSSSYYH